MSADGYRVRKDRVLFVDVEMTCWKGGAPSGERAEIIEFGIAEVDTAELRVTRSASVYVRPTFSRVTSFCTELTGIDTALLRREGVSLPDAARILSKKWGVGGKAWMSWGSDRRAVDADFAAVGLVSPFSASFHDLGVHFSLISGGSRSIGMAEALSAAGVQRTGSAHSGRNDAVSLAELWISFARRLRAIAAGDGG